MKIKFLFLITLFLISILFLPNVSVADYTEWSLPEGAKIRLGKGTIKEVKLSPDGTLLAVASSIGVWLYDAHTGEELTLLTGHTRSVNRVAFSPDGKILASGSADSTIRLWEVSTGTHLKTLKGHTGGVTSVCFSWDGRTLASAGGDITIRLWRVAYGTHLKTLKVDELKPDHFPSNVAFSSDGNISAIISSRGNGKEIYLWDPTSGTQRKILTEQTDPIKDIAFSNDGKSFAGASGNKIHLWGTASGKHLKTLTAHKKPVSSVAFSRNGNTLASASEDEIYLWDTTSGTHSKTPTAHTDSIISLDFSDDGKTLVSANKVEVCLWDTTSGKHLKTLMGHTAKETYVAFSNDGKTIASTSGKEIHLWDWDAAATYRKTLKGHTGFVTDVDFSSDSKTIASASLDKTIRLWDAVSGKYLQTFIEHTKPVYSIAFRPDNSILASKDKEGKIFLWDVVSGALRISFGEGTFIATEVSFSPDGKTLASVANFNSIRLWDAVSGKHLKDFSAVEDIFFTDFAFSKDGQTIAGAAQKGIVENKIFLWDAVSGELRKILTSHDTTGIIHGVTFRQYGNILASISGHEIYLWHISSGERLKILTGHGTISRIAFSSDGKTLASASSDGTVLLWNTSDWNIPSPQGIHKLTPEDIAEKAKASTVVVIADVWNPKDGSGTRLGSGFVLPIFGRQSNMIATNYHVVKHFFNDDVVFDSYVRLVNKTKHYKIEEIVAVDKKNDLAILKINGFIDSLALGDSNEVESGMSVYVVGNPKGREGTFSDGIVSATPAERNKTHNRIQITAPISEGSSGGPMLNSKGEVIGIVVASAAEERLELVRNIKGEVVDITVRKVPVGQNLNFAVPSNFLQKLLNEVRKKE